MRNEPDPNPLTLDELDAMLTRVLEAQVNRDPAVLTEDEARRLQEWGVVVRLRRPNSTILMTPEFRDKIKGMLAS